MPQYIKSHSNYVLKSKHQTLADGSTIFERDITTIGGLNQFAPGQKPIYRSNNFIITVRDDGGISNQYNRKKWTENKVSGNIWTATALKSIVSNDDDNNDTKIVLKQDYYDFRDFCYYGSLAEMFRASITDIIARFPGELYGTSNNVYYTTGETIDGEWIEDRVQLGDNDDGKYYIVNPFGINMHARNLPKDADPLKYFANRGFENYVIVSGETEYNINEWRVDEYYSVYDPKTKKYTPYTASTNFEHDGTVTTSITSGDTTTTYHPCKGEKVGAMDVNHIDSDSTKSINLDIFAWLGDDDVVYYLSNDCQDVHIRPNSDYINKFYDESDNFQKLILNRNTTPKYKATFSVIKEDDNGYYRDFEDFIFPTSEGGYNIDASSYGFNTYTTRLSQIGEFYDEFFTDNLYRSMTHEAIKNFDWTYTREYVEGDEEEYVLGGQKMQKALRVFAREFDEILLYINNIKNLNRVTYDERGNLPDYFLTDTVENEGWNVKLVTPFDVSGSTTFTDGDCVKLERTFVEASGDVKPYTKEFLDDDKNGYFITCCGNDEDNPPCGYEGGGKYKKSAAGDNEFTRMDSCAAFPIIRNRIKSYTDERTYTYNDVNNEFLRRLKLNSRAIWRHKGTIEGIDMILSMFGLRNKKFYNELSSCKKKDYDYEITEYIAKTNPIIDCWDEPHQMYHIDWINSTKTITYDYRSVSNYNRDGSDVSYLPYQGLVIKYLNVGYFTSANTSTSIDYYIDLFKKEIQKTVQNNPKEFVKVTNILSDDTFKIGRKTFKIDRIKDVVSVVGEATTYEIKYGTRRDLFPNFEKYEQYDGSPYFQMNGGWQDKAFKYNYNNTGDKFYPFQFDVDDNIVFTKKDELFKETVRNIRRFDTLQEMLSVPSYEITDGQIVYVTKIKSDIAVLDGMVYNIKKDNFGSYIELIKANGVVRAGDDLYFDEVIRVYDRYGAIKSINLNEIPNGQPIYCYIVNGTIQCYNDIKSYSTFDVVDPNEAGYTNYFKIGDFSQSNRLYNNTNAKGGWKRLSKGEASCKMLDTIINDNKGNNPHNGMMVYDNGREYFKYYEELFKYAYENDMFDERCYNDYYSYKSTISGYGFTSLTDNNGKPIYYTSEKIDDYSNNKKNDISNTDLNTKVIKITFKLHNNLFVNTGQNKGKGDCEMKYIDDIVMNYLTQMIPSTAILQIRYEK